VRGLLVIFSRSLGHVTLLSWFKPSV
jgi:hypothetical protein